MSDQDKQMTAIGASEIAPQIAAPVATDISENVTLVARTPEEMRIAQSGLAQWFAAKIDICRKDVVDLEASLAIAKQHNVPMPALVRQHKAAQGRVEFYEKCHAAIEAGFCIVPNFPVDVFAVRTKRKRPDNRYNTREVQSESPALGDGQYVNASPDLVTRKALTGWDKDDNPIYGYHRFAEEFKDNVEFPVSISKPEVLGETLRAMAEKIFDEIGIAPERPSTTAARNQQQRAIAKKQDPIVVGIIRQRGVRRDSAKVVTFLLAWWINTADL